MKHILVIAIAFFTLNATAQQQKSQQRQGDRKERSQRMDRFKDFTPEEMAQLKTKKMTLEFDLTEAQQKDVYKLNLQEAKDKKQMMEERKAKMEERKNAKNQEKGERKGQKMMLSKEERFNMANNNLDKQIAHKTEMKRILNKEQFEKWEKVNRARFEKNKTAPQKDKQGKKGNKNSKKNN